MGGTTQTVAYAYNASEALTSLTYPSGHVVQYSPDAFGRARTVLPYVSQVSYHPNGMPNELRHAGAVRENNYGRPALTNDKSKVDY